MCFKTNKLAIYSLFIFLALISCQKEEIAQELPILGKINIHGYIQKGPFINGSTLVIAELDDSLAATGKTFTTQITDNTGTFAIKTSQLDFHNLQLMATGFYFDEVKGEKSAAQLTLFALADISEAEQINVNVLSHLEKERVIYLINQGKSFTEAKKQVQREILAIFGIEKEDIANAETLDISQEGEDNAILLAVSAILQGNNTVAELSELLADITADIREDGKLDSEKLKEELKANAIALDLNKVRQYVQNRYAELGVEASIPAFEQYVDSDGDRILNKDDDDLPDEFVFASIQNAKRNTIYTSEPITLTGLPYPAIAKVTNGILLKNRQAIQGFTTSVTEGDVIQLQLQSMLNWGEEVIATLQVGDYTTHFTVATEQYPWATTISGFVQEGPFINGSSLTVSELDSALTETSVVYTTKTTDSRGSYQFNNVQFSYPWTLLEAKGYYFNMISGKSSDGELQLVSYTDISLSDKANINVITHLENRRVRYLVNTGMSFTEAKKQALQEVLGIFEINQELSTTAEHFNLTQSNTESAILIAISAMLQGYENTGALSSLLTNISLDLETDGKLDDEILGSALINNAFYLDLPVIRQNLANRYKELGEEIQIPDFEKYIKNFTQNTHYKLTNTIEFPEYSNYGENILFSNKQTFKAGKKYSLAADLPEGATLKIKIKGGLWYIQIAPNGPINWDITIYDQKRKSQIFTALESDTKTDLIFTFAQAGQPITIEYYEYGSSTPTRIKKITVTK